jgi:hypothetical protein
MYDEHYQDKSYTYKVIPTLELNYDHCTYVTRVEGFAFDMYCG